MTKVLFFLLIWGDADGVVVSVPDMATCEKHVAAIEANNKASSANKFYADCLSVEVVFPGEEPL